MSAIKIYGTGSCQQTQHARRHLKHLGVRHDYFDIHFDPHARTFVRMQNNGKHVTPTVVIDGDVLTEPSDQEIEQLLRDKALMPGMSRGG